MSFFAYGFLPLSGLWFVLYMWMVFHSQFPVITFAIGMLVSTSCVSVMDKDDMDMYSCVASLVILYGTLLGFFWKRVRDFRAQATTKKKE
jgi:hypothetical protein